ncbi:MAG TPA: DUF1997 domain-containing protein [Candidatus Caenarcaniphilales bacterium]
MHSAVTESFSGRPAPLSVDINSTSSIDDNCYPVGDNADQHVVQSARFQSQFTGCMELYADAKTVAQYLDAHQGWFCRCAHPMEVEPLGANGYALVIGHFGAFGYEVEPVLGLELLPPEQGVYRIRTIPIPNHDSQGYRVDFQAALQLAEVPIASEALAGRQARLTRVEWHLDLAVLVQFPRFIRKLPQGLIQRTGDRLLTQIVRQVSHRLTTKVQEDFHKTLGLPLPPSSKKH